MIDLCSYSVLDFSSEVNSETHNPETTVEGIVGNIIQQVFDCMFGVKIHGSCKGSVMFLGITSLPSCLRSTQVMPLQY